MAAVVELSDEVVALSELVSKWRAENEAAIADQAHLAKIQKSILCRQRRMDALCKAADSIVQSMARTGCPTYTVNDLL